MSRIAEDHEDVVVALLSELIRVDTSNPPGKETAAALVVDAFFRRHGLEGELVGETRFHSVDERIAVRDLVFQTLFREELLNELLGAGWVGDGGRRPVTHLGYEPSNAAARLDARLHWPVLRKRDEPCSEG